jgi:hypothetical protein
MSPDTRRRRREGSERAQNGHPIRIQFTGYHALGWPWTRRQRTACAYCAEHWARPRSWAPANRAVGMALGCPTCDADRFSRRHGASAERRPTRLGWFQTVTLLGVMPLTLLVPDIGATMRRFGVHTRHARARAAVMTVWLVRVILADLATPETPRANTSVRGLIGHPLRVASRHVRRKPSGSSQRDDDRKEEASELTPVASAPQSPRSARWPRRSRGPEY